MTSSHTSRAMWAVRNAVVRPRCCGNGMHISSKAYNPYRPDPPELPKEPRRVVMKNLKFGRLAQAASAGVEGARRSLAETTSASDGLPRTSGFHSSSYTSTPTVSTKSLHQSSSAATSSQGSSANAIYRNGQSVPVAVWALLAAGAVAAAAAYLNQEGGNNPAVESADMSLADTVSATEARQRIVRDWLCNKLIELSVVAVANSLIALKNWSTSSNPIYQHLLTIHHYRCRSGWRSGSSHCKTGS